MTLEYYRGCTEVLEAQRNEERARAEKAEAELAEYEAELTRVENNIREAIETLRDVFLREQPVDPHAAEKLELAQRLGIFGRDKAERGEGEE